MSQSATAFLCDHIHATSYEHLPPDVVTIAKQALLDFIGCSLGGHRTPLAALAHVHAELNPGPVPVIGSRAMASPGGAAFANALLANALDYDDSGEGGHPGSTIWAAALSALVVASRQVAPAPISGKDLLTAAVLAYEACARIGGATRPTHERWQAVHGMNHQAFGAAAASARLLRLDQNQTRHAFGLAGAWAPVNAACKFGWEERPLSWIKDNVAAPAEAGLRAAVMARAGMRGHRAILDGPGGFWIMAGSDRFDVERLTEPWGADWQLRHLSFKYWPACRWLHAGIDALLAVLTRTGWRPADITAVRLYSLPAVADQFHDPEPEAFVDAEFSGPYALAAAAHAIPAPDWYLPANLADPALRRFAGKVTLLPLTDAVGLFTQRRKGAAVAPAMVEVEGPDGAAERAEVLYCKGHSENPMSPAELTVKFQTLAASAGVDPETLINLVLRLEEQADASALTALLVSHSQEG